MNTESCRCCQEDAPLLVGKLENIEYITQNADFTILCLNKPANLYLGILINVNVNCEIMRCNKHQQQITNKLIICITETKN